LPSVSRETVCHVSPRRPTGRQASVSNIATVPVGLLPVDRQEVPTRLDASEDPFPGRPLDANHGRWNRGPRRSTPRPGDPYEKFPLRSCAVGVRSTRQPPPEKHNPPPQRGRQPGCRSAPHRAGPDDRHHGPSTNSPTMIGEERRFRTGHTKTPADHGRNHPEPTPQRTRPVTPRPVDRFHPAADPRPVDRFHRTASRRRGLLPSVPQHVDP